MKQRQCVALLGGSDWCVNASEQLLDQFDSSAILVVSDDLVIKGDSVKSSQIKSQLGKEYDAAVFDGLTTLSADSLGIAMGTIRAGGVLILLLPTSLNDSLWAKRFQAILEQYRDTSNSFHLLSQGQHLPQLDRPSTQTLDYQTRDQQQVISAIHDVISGHRRRPLVISADRGRGKSAALGLAAAELVQEGKRRILITAPSLSTAETLFKHAAISLPQATVSAGLILIENSRIEFMAPDAIIETQPEADLLMVDEAAAIPAAMLTKLLIHYSRVVFATTIHGYEGTGRGFAIRFNKMLDLYTPGWKQRQMKQPIRWLENDTLEAFSYDALLLNATPVDDAKLKGCQRDDCQIEKVNKSSLLEDEAKLKALFGLMVTAHYRTRPSDLTMMLDRDDISIYAMTYQGHVLATAWLVDEGNLDEELAKAIYQGTRRPAGHLLPQSLLTHAGLMGAGLLRYRRVMRIAVHPVLQRQGLASSLIKKIAQESKRDNIDALGISYSIDVDLLHFWQATGFQVARLGLHKSHVSEGRSLMMLKPLSPAANKLTTTGKKRFSEQWPELLCRQFNDLDVELVIRLSQMLERVEITLSPQDWQDITSFAHHSRLYECCQLAIRRFVLLQLTQCHFVRLNESSQHLLILLVVQEKSWTETAKIMKQTGRNQLVTSLRQAVSELLSYAKSD